MRVRPLTGQVLIRVLPAESVSAGGIAFPEYTLTPEEVQQTHRDPKPPPPLYGVVEAIGAWPALPSGRLQMPEFGIGARVIIGPHAGQQMQRGIGERLRMVRQDQVLAVVT